MVVGATLAVGGVGLGLIVGYVRGRARGYSVASSQRISPELDMLAGVGTSILSVQLKVDALCEVVYQQTSRIVDTSNFQIGLFEGKDYHIKVWFKGAERLPAQRFESAAEEGIIGWISKAPPKKASSAGFSVPVPACWSTTFSANGINCPPVPAMRLKIRPARPSLRR
jgi:hypothetical protein